MHHSELLINLSLCFGAALTLGLLTQRLGLSPILGYLLAGIVLGPQTPGFVADQEMAAQFAEVGVILLMFGVGLHFHVEDLKRVRSIALTGALAQISVSTLLGVLAAHFFGRGAASGLIIGISISVASTVVLIRVLTDNDLLQTPQGHIAVGWLIMEDIFTVLVLVVLPGIAGLLGGKTTEEAGLLFALLTAIGKILALTLFVFLLGRFVIPKLLRLVALTKSRELFTLTVLSLALGIAAGSGELFGVSMALGAFLAGMAVGQTEVSHQAAADAMPLKDAFAVLFFIAVGMLFDWQVIRDNPAYLFSMLAIVLIAKPAAAFTIVWIKGYSLKSGLVVAVGLAQIGEFSFILSGLGEQLQIIGPQGRSLLVACSLISITLNPLLFRAIPGFEHWLRIKKPKLWTALNRRSLAKSGSINKDSRLQMEESFLIEVEKTRAIVVGHGPVGQNACRVLREFGVQAVVVDLNLDTVQSLSASGTPAIYGNASHKSILEAAGVKFAHYLLITIPDPDIRTSIILTAREFRQDLKILVRSRYLTETDWLKKAGATAVCSEEGEVAMGLSLMLLREVGASEERIREEVQRVFK